MLSRTADHLRVDQRVRELLSTLIEEWGVNTFRRGVNFRALDLAYPESGLDKCPPCHFSPRSSTGFLPIVRLAIIFHVPGLSEGPTMKLSEDGGHKGHNDIGKMQEIKGREILSSYTVFSPTVCMGGRRD